MKGILICGGIGSRLKPLTDITNKSLLPVYDKPLITYPLQTLLNAEIEDIMIITGTEHIDQISEFLGNGSKFGCRFSFAVQEKPQGIAQALGMAESFADEESICAILGDNIYFENISDTIKSFEKGGHIFLKEVPDPERFGVVEIEGDRVVSIEEKPQQPKSNLAHTGCYLYDARCFEIARSLTPSARGELEISDISKWYLDQNELTASILQDEWIDSGTFESLFKAAKLVRARKLAAIEGAKSVPQAVLPSTR